jgi:alpha-ketoglutarate-dependent taurine dioxygenase
MSERLTITPLGPYIGAQVSGLDVTRPLSDNQFEQLYHAVLRHQVVFLREQAITPQQQRAGPALWRSAYPPGLSACGRGGGDYRSGYPQR